MADVTVTPLFPTLKTNNPLYDVSATGWNQGHKFGGGSEGALLVYAAAATRKATWIDAVAAGNVLLSGGLLAAPAWGKVGLTTHVSGILPTANGGTGIAYFTVAGPTVARVYTFPDAAATVLTTNAAVTVAQGGTGLATLTAHALYVGNGAGAPTALAVGATGTVLIGNTGADPSWSATPSVTSVTIASYVAIGTNPATVGIVRIPNSASMFARNGANSGDVALLGLTASNAILVGGSGESNIILGSSGVHTVPTADANSNLGSASFRFANGYFVALIVGTNPATTGAIRIANNTYAVWRDAANVANLAALGVDTSNNFIVGSDFTSVQLGGGSPVIKVGGLTSAFPALKRSSASLIVRLADDSADADFSAAGITVSGNYKTSGTVATAGDFRARQGFTLQGRNSGDSANRSLLDWGGTTSNELYVGDANVATRFQGTAFSFLTGVVNFAVALSGPGTPATSGDIRLQNTGAVVGRNAGNSANVNLIESDSSDRVLIGNAASDIRWGKALVAMGGVTPAIIGTIAGAGPATAAQDSWMRVIDSGGAAFWVPAWK